MFPECYKRESSKKTPRVIIEPGLIFIMGRSIPENPGEFYRTVYEWICEYIKEDNRKTKIGLGFEYINTASIKWVYSILKEVSKMKDLALNSRIYWYYEQSDDDIRELGFILRSLMDCPFVIVEVEEMNGNLYERFLSESI